MTERTRQDLGARRLAREFLHVAVGGPDDQLLRRADLHDLAVAHDGDAVGEPDRLVEIVGDEDDGLLQKVLQTQELVLHLAADQRVERGERLVEEPELRADGERAGDAHALLLAAGKLLRQILLAPAEPDELDHLARALLALVARDALDLEREGDVAEHREMRQQREMLEHHAHAVAPELDQLALGHRQEVAPVEEDVARWSARPAARGSAPASTCPSRKGP